MGTPQRQQQSDEQRTSFNPNDHLMKIKSGQSSQDYLPVQWRLVWYRLFNERGQIITLRSLIELEREITKEISVWNNETRKMERVSKTAKGWAYFEVRVIDDKGASADGEGSECAVDFEDYIEKAATKAVGRALAKLGYGTQFAPDFNEMPRIVDAPIEHKEETPIVMVRPGAQRQQTPENVQNLDKAESVTEQQLMSIRKLCEHLGKAEPDHIQTLSYNAAKYLIHELSREYRDSLEKPKGTGASTPPPPPVTPHQPPTTATITRKAVTPAVPLPPMTPPVQQQQQQQQTAGTHPQGDASIVNNDMQEHILRPWETKLGPSGFAHVVEDLTQVKLADRLTWSADTVNRIVVNAQKFYGPDGTAPTFEQWGNQKALPIQNETLQQLRKLFPPTALIALINRLREKGRITTVKVKDYTVREMDTLLAALKSAEFLCLLAYEVDNDYSLLKSIAPVDHPLDLIEPQTNLEGVAFETYQKALVTRVDVDKLSATFLERFGETLGKLTAQYAPRATAA